uniref:F5/8 type C domain-containing protein n=1 Tax=uncultured Bacillota bacterium TaxID=344338 RepID=A0A650EPR4_9FIRM|nr:hypothetical protein Firmicute1046_3240 [uncultured Firmicutes bacterium]
MITDKKVFAEYHNPRYTRERDGELGNWAYANESKDSKAVVKRCNYNADLIDSKGRNQLAAVNYPIVGMQSQNDPDYIEYQILLAKLAYIDGFMTDFRHLEDEAGVTQLELLREVAKKYKFEIGVDWCDAQIFYSLKKVRPDLDTREKQIEYCKNIFRYLLRRVYQDETGANIDGHPVILLFGDGFSFEEYRRLKKDTAEYTEKEPWYFRRTMMDCAYDGKTVTYSFDEKHEYFTQEHRREIAGPFGWVPFRLRDAVADGKPYWDVYANEEDCLKYLETLRSHVKENRDNYQAWISVVTPGMDQRGCAAWGRPITYIERGNGEIYRAMWEDNLGHCEETDAIFIAGWNDFNEGHEIEPTVENGYRELELTAEYSARFKGAEQKTKPEDFRLPEQLFALRKRAAKLSAIGYATDDVQDWLDSAALRLAERDGGAARLLLERAQEAVTDLWNKKQTVKVAIPAFEVVQSSERVDIAGLAKITASSALPNCEGERIVDGERARSFWQSEEGAAEATLVWTESCKINSVKLFTGWTERADKPNWPMIPQALTVECRTEDGWVTIWSTESNTKQDIEISCSQTTDALRISSRDPIGLVLRGVEVLTENGRQEGIGCYDGAVFRMPETYALQFGGRVFDGYLTFQYWDGGFGTFEVTSAGKFPTVCRITMDDTHTWQSAKVRVYPSNTAWEKQAELLFRGNVRVKDVAAEFDIYEKG